MHNAGFILCVTLDFNEREMDELVKDSSVWLNINKTIIRSVSYERLIRTRKVKDTSSTATTHRHVSACLDEADWNLTVFVCVRAANTTWSCCSWVWRDCRPTVSVWINNSSGFFIPSPSLPSGTQWEYMHHGALLFSARCPIGQLPPYCTPTPLSPAHPPSFSCCFISLSVPWMKWRRHCSRESAAPVTCRRTSSLRSSQVCADRAYSAA